MVRMPMGMCFEREGVGGVRESRLGSQSWAGRWDR